MSLGRLLVEWYKLHSRSLPWRYDNGDPPQPPDPYRVWVSEIMLQQTTVAGVIPYYERFLRQFPSVEVLAMATQDEVLDAWAGLGYYARGRNLHKCAKMIMADYGGKFPEDEAALLSLAGIGDYTAAAIMTIAFNKPAVALDGNGKRVLARLFAETEPVKSIDKKLRQHYADIFYRAEPSAFAQAMMDLGAMVCTPTSPQCVICPLREACKGKSRWREIPYKVKKSALPIRYGALFYLYYEDKVILRRRDEKSMLGGCIEFIGTAWDNKSAEVETLWEEELLSWCREYDVEMGLVESLDGVVEHSFTHYKLRLVLRRIGLSRVQFDRVRGVGGVFVIDRVELGKQAFPSLMEKALKKIVRIA